MRQPTNLSSPLRPHPIPLSPVNFIGCVLSSSSRLKTFTLWPATFFLTLVLVLFQFLNIFIQCSPLVPLPKFPSYLSVNTVHSIIVPVGFKGTQFPEKYSVSKLSCFTSVGTIWNRKRYFLFHERVCDYTRKAASINWTCCWSLEIRFSGTNIRVSHYSGDSAL